MINWPPASYRKAAEGFSYVYDEAMSELMYAPSKIREMHQVFLMNNPERYLTEREKRFTYLREAVSYKIFMTTMAMTQLWALEHVYQAVDSIPVVLGNCLDQLSVDDKLIALQSACLETALIQGAAMIEFYLPYILSFFGFETHNGSHPEKWLDTLAAGEYSSPDMEKSRQIQEYFANKVFFSPDKSNEIEEWRMNGWGLIVRQLRNVIVHRDRSQPDFDRGLELIQLQMEDWSDQLRLSSCARMIQDIQNEMFEIEVTITPMLYDLEWISGAYKPGMFNE